MNDGVLKPVEGSVAYWHERDRIAAARESQMSVLRAENERLRADLAHAHEALRRVRDFPYVGAKASQAIVCIARDGLREYEQETQRDETC